MLSSRPLRRLWFPCLAAIPIATFLVLGLFTGPTADDFCNADRLARLGYSASIKGYYLEWTGRYASASIALLSGYLEQSTFMTWYWLWPTGLIVVTLASTYALLAAKLAGNGAALFSTHHGIHGRPDGRTRFYERFYTRVVLPRYDRVLSVSLADGEELAEMLGPRVRVHMNGVDGRPVAVEDRPRVRAEIRAAWPKLPRVSERPNRWLTRNALLCFGNRSVVGRLTTVKSGWTTLSDKSFES